MVLVSVPFTRGTPLWHLSQTPQYQFDNRFSPLHEGDTSVAAMAISELARLASFSPLHEGDTSVARRAVCHRPDCSGFSPLHEGDTSVAWCERCGGIGNYSVSVPFTRGTPLWLSINGAFGKLGNKVSVPFTRGTPLWLL